MSVGPKKDFFPAASTPEVEIWETIEADSAHHPSPLSIAAFAGLQAYLMSSVFSEYSRY